MTDSYPDPNVALAIAAAKRRFPETFDQLRPRTRTALIYAELRLIDLAGGAAALQTDEAYAQANEAYARDAAD